MEIGAGDGTAAAAPVYRLQPCRFCCEDILFCVDVDVDSQADMKASGAKGRPLTRLDAIKQSILLFVHAKLSINAEHRFAYSVLDRSFSWCWKEFSNDIGSAKAAVQALIAADSPYGVADLTQLFKVANHEARKSITQGRIFRVVLIYCRSSTRPQHQWPVSPKHFTLDIIYLHDRPGPENCPQKVYDALVDTLEHVSEYEGYIFESGPAFARTLFKLICMLLCHPHQRCTQDFFDLPKSLTRKQPSQADAIPIEEGSSVPVQ